MRDLPLRAFLMLRGEDAGWKVHVCRDLGSLIRAWLERSDPENDTGVLHIGFEKPGSDHFEDLAKSNRGRLLLTESAKHSLPAGFTCSEFPIGSCGRLNVFLGLTGWGYTAEDPASSQCVEDPSPRHPKRRLEGWVKSYCDQHPEDAEVLDRQGILDDESYLEHESRLARELRYRIGSYRSNSLVGSHISDPGALARSAPPWLAERHLEGLGLSVRSRNVFRANRIKQVKDLGSFSVEALLRLSNFGRTSLKDTIEALRFGLNEGPPAVEADSDQVDQFDPLLRQIRQSVYAYSGIKRDILLSRLGFDREPLTLQKLADKHRVTRERIRQIERRAINDIRREASWVPLFPAKIIRYLNGRDSALPVSGVEALDPWFDGLSAREQLVEKVIEAFCDKKIHIVKVNGMSFFSRIDQETFDDIVSQAKELLSSGVDAGWEEDYARAVSIGLLPDRASDLGSLLWDQVFDLCQFSDNGDRVRILTGFGRGADHLVKAILAESSTPLHYSEIARRAMERRDRKLDPRRAHNAAANVALLFGRGCYGLAQHVPFSEQQLMHVANEAEEIIAAVGADRQWHSTEILGELSERLDSTFEELDKYIVNIALQQFSNLHYLGKLTWSASTAQGGRGRIDIHQAIISIIKTAGRPMKTNEIREELTVVRGVNEFFQIYPQDPLIRLGPGLWGLNERDLPLSRKKQLQLLNRLIEVLEDRGSGIHESELHKHVDLQHCNPASILSIAYQDEMLSVAQGQYVYLSKWEGPRRETVRAALEGSLASASEPISIDTLTSLVQDRLGRKIDPTSIRLLLRTVDAVCDDQTKRWSLGGGEQDEMD